ncbi:type I toxin-antitoxin system toxin IbsC [Escherichia coli]|uniref:Small toxic protein IbsC n=11 Tax=Enterobacteriaceae TaxID=543 RepID=IBSC_ECOLI|nr:MULTISPECIES: type I toxin-antitoxin system toxin IbsC [Bacteria]YP_002791255.1 toxic peptide IbsC [Escherichia coli str. K-12 substr. MG1655]C1P615.1 RecName: Full=Small toxic protein IbsC [Escherichia coli K-12]AGX34908.1 toxic membrane protein [synthetic Escherichia coli C321.deltaA]EBR8995761.1 small toxic protein IbsC [Salmonella enterica subsp. enterica serovar Agona]ECJ3916059.1 small toxic protein IbsC [Salmonella enterica subsp. enterica]EEY7945673.1 type I toxin-antitoxin system 
MMRLVIILIVLLLISFSAY